MPQPTIARRAMVDSQLRPQGVTHAGVLAAMGSVPREQFVPEGARDFAYFDRSIALPGGGAMMPPAALGQLLSALDPEPGERALVVSQAPGYTAALLTAIGLEVETAAPGAAPRGPYQLILLDGAVEEFPVDLAAALVPGGRAATALAERGVTRLAVGINGARGIAFRTIADADVAPLADYFRPPAFSF